MQFVEVEKLCYYIEKQSRCLDVVLFCGNVQRRKPDLSTSITLEEDSNDFVMTLLHGHRQWGEAILGGQTLVGSVGQKETHHSIVVLLGSHVEWSESILGLHIHGGIVLQQ